jgi:hypothetical protein
MKPVARWFSVICFERLIRAVELHRVHVQCGARSREHDIGRMLDASDSSRRGL